MKVELLDDKIIVYLYSKLIDINNNNDLNNQIKTLFIKIMKRYNLDFFGYNKVNVYQNDYYGMILEIEKIYDSGRYNVIDLKIVIYKSVPMYLEFNDLYCFDILPKLKFYNDKYYLEINSDININKYIEYGRISYSPNLKKLLNKID